MRRLAGALGVETDGPSIDTIRKLVDEHLVVVMRGFEMDENFLSIIAGSLGEIHASPLVEYLPDAPGVVRHENTGKANAFTECWHTDLSFTPDPPRYGLLYADTVPEFGGDTMWSNQNEAAAKMSDGLFRVLEDMQAVHEHSEGISATHYVTRVDHSLYVSPRFTTRFKGWTREESAPLLGYLHSLTTPDLIYRHQWRQGDLVVWDNWATNHYAIHDYGDAERVLYRVCVR